LLSGQRIHIHLIIGQVIHACFPAIHLQGFSATPTVTITAVGPFQGDMIPRQIPKGLFRRNMFWKNNMHANIGAIFAQANDIAVFLKNRGIIRGKSRPRPKKGQQ
jgi:hypothetical protein